MFKLINEDQILLLILFLENMSKEQRLISLIQKKLKDEDNESDKLSYKSLTREEKDKIEKIKKDILKEEKKNLKKEENKEEKNEESPNSININVKFSVFNINIYKSLTPEEEIIIEKYKDKEYEKNKKFMVLTLKNFETKININNEIIDSKVQLGYIYLYDTDYEILQNGNKKEYLNSEFNCIFGTSIKTEIKENKFKLSELLQTSISDNQKKTEYTINIIFNSNSKEKILQK